MEHTRTIRIDLNKISQEDCIELLKYKGIEKCIVYYERSQRTKKPHLQGWIKFVGDKEVKNFVHNVLRVWKRQKSLTREEVSCAIVKKETYYSYCAKDKKCVYSVGVTEEERIENEEKSYKKQETYQEMKERVIMEMRRRQEEGVLVLKQDIAERIIEWHVKREKPIYVSTVKGQTLLIWCMIKEEYGRMAREFFSD